MFGSKTIFWHPLASFYMFSPLYGRQFRNGFRRFPSLLLVRADAERWHCLRRERSWAEACCPDNPPRHHSRAPPSRPVFPHGKFLKISIDFQTQSMADPVSLGTSRHKLYHLYQIFIKLSVWTLTAWVFLTGTGDVTLHARRDLFGKDLRWCGRQFALSASICQYLSGAHEAFIVNNYHPDMNGPQWLVVLLTESVKIADITSAPFEDISILWC